MQTPGYIDLSKRRVSAEEVVKCEEQYEKGKTVDSIITQVARKRDVSPESLYEKIAWPLHRQYGHSYEAFKLSITYVIPFFPQAIPYLTCRDSLHLQPRLCRILALRARHRCALTRSLADTHQRTRENPRSPRSRRRHHRRPPTYYRTSSHSQTSQSPCRRRS